jgi:hypothetical protein
MASKRRIRRQQCGRKIKYHTRHEAATAAYKSEQKFKDGWMDAYKCPFCKCWHVGHTPKWIINKIKNG